MLLARDSDVEEATAPGATTPDVHAVPTAEQVRTLAARIGALVTGHALLGTYDASSSQIGTVAPIASTGSRAAFAAAGKIQTGTGMSPGDYFVITAAGTIAGETATINGAAKVGDQIFYDGQEWRVVPLGNAGGTLLHGLADVNDVPVLGMVKTLPAVTAPAGTLTDGVYTVTPTGGSGTGLQLRLTVAGGAVTRSEVIDAGSNYAANDALVIPQAQVTGATADGSLTLTAANLGTGYRAAVAGEGILVRDPAIADGLPNAFKVVSGIDAGTY